MSSSNNKWTNREIKSFKKIFPLHTNYELLKKFPRHTYKSIEKKALELGLYKNSSFKNAPWALNIDKKKKEVLMKNNDEKLKYELKFYKQKYGEEKHKRLSEEKLLEQLKTVLSVQKPLKHLYKPPKKKIHAPQEAILLFSDCQVGEKIQKKETGFLEYNIDIFAQRLNKLYSSLLNIIARHRKDHPIYNLNIFMLGDIVEGRKIFTGQSARITTDIVEQMFKGQALIANFLRSLAPHFQKVKIWCIPGNHGRVGEKRGEELAYVNWDHILYRNLEQILSQINNIHFNINQQWWQIVDIFGWKFYLEHGEMLKKYWGISWYSMERRDNRILQMMRSLKRDYDYYIVGHLHESFEWDKGRGERIGNGAFVSGNPFAMRELGLITRPTQKLFGIHKEVGITWRYNIRLDFGKSYIK